jgi:hypothetical protein
LVFEKGFVCQAFETSKQVIFLLSSVLESTDFVTFAGFFDNERCGLPAL